MYLETVIFKVLFEVKKILKFSTKLYEYHNEVYNVNINLLYKF